MSFDSFIHTHLVGQQLVNSRDVYDDARITTIGDE